MSHSGITRTILRAKELVFWPLMVKEITDVVKKCPACLTYQNSQAKEPMIIKESASRPWQIITANLFTLQSREYLLLVDSYTKYPEIHDLDKDKTSEPVITCFKQTFPRFGKPNILYTDNGPQFANRNFQSFLKNWEVELRTSSPCYPQSNELIQRHVQTIKKILKKALYDNKDKYLALLEYRSTPICNKTPSPVELFFGRKVKGQVAISEKLLEPQKKLPEVNIKNNRQRQSIYYNRHTKELTPLQVNNRVMVQPKN
ncbi:Integrase zinc binding domain [Popillia japonica]|uniref:RNA-directed DNA polymerase n=1 Tax=Popillia japonica TaxID=7064 RepID=A0AAW1MFD5_POPJA